MTIFSLRFSTFGSTAAAVQAAHGLLQLSTELHRGFTEPAITPRARDIETQEMHPGERRHDDLEQTVGYPEGGEGEGSDQTAWVDSGVAGGGKSLPLWKTRIAT